MNELRGSNTYREICSQGKTWASTLDSLESQTEGMADWLRRKRAEVCFVGCGSTYYLSQAAALVWQSLTGLRASARPSSELWLFPEANLPAQPSLLVAVSRSGETTETLHALDLYRQRANEEILAITCYGDRELALRSPHVLLAQEAHEESVAQTRSFSSMYLLAQAAAGITAGNAFDELKLVPRSFDRLLHEYEDLARRLARESRLQRFIFLGSGPYYGLACETMLKMKEMSLSISEAFHFLEFRHGPKSVIDPSTLVIGLVGENARQHEAAVLSEMRALGATVLAVSETSGGLDADYVVELRSGLGSLARAALNLPVLQLLAYYRAMEKGLDPDRPTNLEAVVRF